MEQDRNRRAAIPLLAEREADRVGRCVINGATAGWTARPHIVPHMAGGENTAREDKNFRSDRRERLREIVLAVIIEVIIETGGQIAITLRLLHEAPNRHL